jgi:hypothetical protein
MFETQTPYKLKIFFILLFFYFPYCCVAQQKFEKAGFYNIMDTGKMQSVDNELELVKTSDIRNKIGYQGALLMKKADLAARPKKKLDLFIAGRKLIETALLVDNENVEFHFLRLTIEEHAPKIVKYHNDIQKDKTIIINKFKVLSPVVQHAILDYCRQSKVLHVDELQVQ